MNLDDELARLDREWETERRAYLMKGRLGREYRPTVASSLFALIVGGGFGLLWTCGGFVLTAGRLSGAAALMPVFGVVFTILAVALGLAGIGKARRYSAAEKAYLQRRRNIVERAD